MPDGRNLIFTFILVSSLFFLWAICNGMIDVMDKHFQTELGLSKSQSAWVQFAHYLGYFLMSLPAGMLASRFGYKWGIIAGLLMVAAGGFWFLPATHFNTLARAGSLSPTTAFVGYLAGVCAIAAGLTFLETVANPYTTVLGPKQYAATRINLAQSCNGAGWIFGPIIGAIFFYSKDDSGRSTGNETLYIPYVTVAIVVLVLAVVFYFANIPDVKTEDDYGLDEDDGAVEGEAAERKVNRVPVYFLMLMNSAVLVGVFAMILSLILSAANYSQSIVWIASGMLFAGAAVALVPIAKKISHHSVWTHPHFSSATLAQFFYVAAQAGIFSFFINSMTSDPKTGFSMVPPIPASWDQAMTNISSSARHFVESLPHWLGWAIQWLPGWLLGWFETNKYGVLCISDKGAANLASLAFVWFLIGRFSGACLLSKVSAHKILGFYGIMNVIACFLVFLNLGWFSVVCIFLSYFFMSIMFPTIFALGIYGLGARAKKASGFIVMAIMGGAILPKLMGAVADKYDMSRGYIVPLFCFAFVAFYGYCWPKLSKAEGLHVVKNAGGH
ncbi:MAG: MFS transporter [Verrucomicrobiota bacterium]|jgi:FHS family L-fucose permease-like MFS transporter